MLDDGGDDEDDEFVGGGEEGVRQMRPDAFGVKRCRDEIISGKYHAIVVIDYSDRDLTNEFEEAFGTLLQQFVRAGGVVAFPSSESCLVSRLQEFFDADWGCGEYYRTNWGPCLEDNKSNIHRNFGSGTLSRSEPKISAPRGTLYECQNISAALG